jgi:hypothetical protein
VAKGGLQCLGAVLSAADPASWAAAAPAWQLLLGFLTDARPKVRRRAVASAVEVLAAAQAAPQLLALQSEAVAQRERRGGGTGGRPPQVRCFASPTGAGGAGRA